MSSITSHNLDFKFPAKLFLNLCLQATWSLLERLPQTRLGKLGSCRTREEMMDLCDGYDPDLNEYRFDRQARNFNCVLNFLSTGKLHLGEETCVIAFSQVTNSQ